MCEGCELAPLCSRTVATKFGSSWIAVGKIAAASTVRFAICVRERGLETQRIFIARSGVLALIEALAGAVRIL